MRQARFHQARNKLASSALHRPAGMLIPWTLPVLRAGSQGTKLSVNLEHETMRTNILARHLLVCIYPLTILGFLQKVIDAVFIA